MSEMIVEENINTANEVERDSGSGFKFKTILEDQEKYHVKHPLNNSWLLTLKSGDVQADIGRHGSVSKEEWNKSLMETVTVGTVEDFWW